MPQRRCKLVGFIRTQEHDLDGSKRVIAVQREIDGIRLRGLPPGPDGPRLRKNLNTRAIDPVRERVDVDSGQHGGHENQDVLF